MEFWIIVGFEKDNEVIYNLQRGRVTSYVDPRSGNVCIAIRYM